MADSHYIPGKVFIKVVQEMDKLNYDIHVGVSLYYYDKQNKHLASPLNSDVIQLDQLEKVLYTPKTGVYLVSYNDGGKQKKKSFTFKKRTTTEVIAGIYCHLSSNELQSIIRKNYNRYTILLDGEVVKFSEKLDALIKANKTRYSLKYIDNITYKPVDNILTFEYKRKVNGFESLLSPKRYTIKFVTDYTGTLIK